MKSTIFTFLYIILYATGNLTAQTGLQLGYIHEKTDNTFFSTQSTGLSIDLNYKFSLVGQVLAVNPGISYIHYFRGNSDDKPSYIGMNFPIQFYPFRISSDCDCPTIEKSEGSVFDNLFLDIIPSFYSNVGKIKSHENFTVHRIFLGVRVGLEIPISRGVVLIPAMSYYPWNDNMIKSFECSPSYDGASNVIVFNLAIRYYH